MVWLRTFFIIASPSSFSLLTTTFGAFGFLALVNWSYLTHSSMFYEFFFGPKGLPTLLNKPTFNFMDMLSIIGDMPLSYNVLVLIGAGVVGLIVYVILEVLGIVYVDTSSTLSELAKGDKQQQNDIFKKLTFRIVTVILWALYAIVFFYYLLPLSVLMTRIGIDGLMLLTNLYLIPLSFVLLWIGIHIHVVFMRLSTFRLRMWGAERVVEAYSGH